MDDKRALVYRNPVYLIETEFLKLYIIVGFVLRIVLMMTAPQDAGFSFAATVRLLGVGVLSDTGMGILLALPLQIVYLGLNEAKYRRVAGWMIEGLLAIAFVYVLCFHSVFDEYGGGAPRIAKLFLGWKLASFSLRFFLPRIRAAWRRASLYFAWAVYVFLLLCVSAGEYFFWQEFGVRYNFIAVDYLVYTHEVIGNIMESYAIIPMLILAFLFTVGIILWQSRRRRFKLLQLYTPKLLASHLGIYAAFSICAYFLLWGTHTMQGDNQYVTQLEQNGACDFVIAFQNNKLEYDKFYAMLPRQEAESLYRKEAGLDAEGKKTIGDSVSPHRPNIVLITVESLSADFLARYRNRQGLTPQLDRLMTESLVFDSLYAAGNRTVRGLEALSLCIPPSAGESIIKRKENRMSGLSVGAVLGGLGYRCQFLYGGNSYFDNMGDYFSHNGYEVIDRSRIANNKITFANIWGVCDEDIFSKSLEVFDEDARNNKPFFAQIMTTSNHRPYTYPAGKIHVNGNPNTREAAVKYTDYAIGKFIREASGKAWFRNTVFVVIADHCASSAGKTSLPIDRYHIPCMVYAPSLVNPAYINKVCSQIDVMPTLLSLLQLKYRVHFAGQNILSPGFHPRAFMATYQDLGYLDGGLLTVLSPVRKIRQYEIRLQSDGTHTEQLVSSPDNKLIRKAQAFYQYVNLYLKAR
ncbi:LTA synthase family protein [Prevotella sp. KH2C16]|uniref:LTA synthase family protein n=1 Tax=Prevotella sp. KH2C16 TaxID=1855325 RepID=UPI0008E7FC22|nr:LTA synthase family protein [Prevotella sp. KH2C16]SFG64571.1 Phosphoglycerol transferase MdoB [Prevotella sp. KH2C16]